MSERLRTGRKVHRTLYEQRGDAPSDGDQLVGMVDTPELAAEICEAVNAARDADAGRPDAELERLRRLERDLSGAVWTHPDIKGGAPCVGGTRVPVEQVASLMVDVPAEDINSYYPSVLPEGAVAAECFAERFVDRLARDDEAEAARSARESVLLMRRELDQAQAELEQARGDLAAATVFWWDDGRIRVGRNADGDYRVSWPHPANSPRYGHPWTEDYPDRDAALARARQIAGEDG